MIMTEKKRSEIRVEEFNMLMIQMQLGMLSFVRTHGDFLDTFEGMMRIKTGDYTPEDEAWAAEALDRFEKRNAVKEKKRGK